MLLSLESARLLRSIMALRRFRSPALASSPFLLCYVRLYRPSTSAGAGIPYLLLPLLLSSCCLFPSFFARDELVSFLFCTEMEVTLHLLFDFASSCLCARTCSPGLACFGRLSQFRHLEFESIEVYPFEQRRRDWDESRDVAVEEPIYGSHVHFHLVDVHPGVETFEETCGIVQSK